MGKETFLALRISDVRLWWWIVAANLTASTETQDAGPSLLRKTSLSDYLKVVKTHLYHWVLPAGGGPDKRTSKKKTALCLLALILAAEFISPVAVASLVLEPSSLGFQHRQKTSSSRSPPGLLHRSGSPETHSLVGWATPGFSVPPMWEGDGWATWTASCKSVT